MRRNLQAALRYWFSHSGTKDRPEPFSAHSLRDTGVGSAVGLHLSWPEAMQSVGANPNDYSALSRVQSLLRARYVDEWEASFESPVPDDLDGRR